MIKTFVYVDGNYLFFQAKALGLAQDFDKLLKGIQRHTEDGEIVQKRFYTRPPNSDGSKAVLGWLKAHGWEASLFRYDGTGQDSVYTKLIPDLMMDMLSADFSQDTYNFVVVSGSGSLSFPFTKLTAALEGKIYNLMLVGTPNSTNAKLLGFPSIEHLSLEDVLQG